MVIFRLKKFNKLTSDVITGVMHDMNMMDNDSCCFEGGHKKLAQCKKYICASTTTSCYTNDLGVVSQAMISWF